VMADPREAMAKFDAAVKWLRQTDSNMLGWKLAALIRQAAPSFQRPSTPCIDSTGFPKSVTCTWQMCLPILRRKQLNSLSEIADGSLVGGHSRS
jgi:hypothetical protein